MIIGLASDHAGYDLKEKIKLHLVGEGIKVVDYGTNSPLSCDYADYAHALAKGISNGEMTSGIAFCGSGNGINISLNRHRKVRSAYCWLPKIAELARQHNDANICTIPARFVSEEDAVRIIHAFLITEFEGGRHLTRINKIEIDQ